MSDGGLPPRPRLSAAIAECRRAEEELAQLEREGLAEVEEALSEKESLHMIQTVFRINGLLYLYDYLRGGDHDTRFGVLLGALTYMLDFVYDQGHYAESEIVSFESVVRRPNRTNNEAPFERELARLAAEAWEAVSDPKSFENYLEAMLETQRASMFQGSTLPMSRESLASLTAEKGHRSLCLFFAAVNRSFSLEEAAALRRFGFYMQYMDDLEDYHEDQLESRFSLVTNPVTGVLRACWLLMAALPDIRNYYGPHARDRVRTVLTWVGLYHVGILFACVSREITQRLPSRPRKLLHRSSMRVRRRSPFFHVAPVSLSVPSRIKSCCEVGDRRGSSKMAP